MRVSHPHECAEFRSTNIQLSWRTPYPERRGLAWCQDCLPFGGEAPARGLLAGIEHHGANAESSGRRPGPVEILETLVRHSSGNSSTYRNFTSRRGASSSTWDSLFGCRFLFTLVRNLVHLF